MQWIHEVSKEWLLARQRCLTATDIVKLYPSAKKWKPGDEIPQTFIGTWFEKHSDIDVNPVSYDAAARGHCMEPFAILDANATYGKNFHHWDDVLIHRGFLGFSPDAMDIPQPVLPVVVEATDEMFNDAKEIMEVKCFQPYHHGQCVIAGVEEKQLLQIAMAFKVLPNLEEAHVLFYCPGAYIDMEKYVFCKSDLDNTLAFHKIDRVLDVWKVTDRFLKGSKFQAASYTEEGIHKLSMQVQGV